MCGIFGSINLGGDFSHDLIRENLFHRGPDGSGFFVDQDCNAFLGHTRLSILDLTTAAKQPMMDATGRYVLIYNGEIYNFNEIKDMLESAGHSFVSHSDTEVVLHSFLEWGPECVKRFRGMFALAILDRGLECGPKVKNSDGLPVAPYLFLARDRFGIKPLVYSFTDKGFVFSSEMKALIDSGLIEKKISHEALRDFMVFGSVQQPRTMLEGVYQLDPGTTLVIDSDLRSTQNSYYKISSETMDLREEYQSLSYNDLVEKTRILLEEATRYHMIADVPVGAFLSGGVDSTAVVALMSRHVPDTIKTFSVGFENNEEMKDELSFARQAAEYLGTDHSEVVVTNDDIKNSFGSLVASIDQPSIDGTNTFLVSRATSKQVKVALSGLGGDELFAGYSHFSTIAENHRRNLFGLEKCLQALHDFRPNRFTAPYVFSNKPPEKAAVLARRQLSARRLKNIANSSVYSGGMGDVTDKNVVDESLSGLPPLARISYAEIRGYLLSTLLRDADVMSMAHSLEVRPVLLDHVLAEHAFALPDNAKIRNGMMKAALVDAVKDLIPETCWSRPKMGFEMPFATWLSTSLHERFVDALSSSHAKAIFAPKALASFQARARSRQAKREDWKWLILLEWLNTNNCTVDL